MCVKKKYKTSVIFLKNNALSYCSHEKVSEEFKVKNIFPNSWQLFFKDVKVIKTGKEPGPITVHSRRKINDTLKMDHVMNFIWSPYFREKCSASVNLLVLMFILSLYKTVKLEKAWTRVHMNFLYCDCFSFWNLNCVQSKKF
jgi:hypothetical protein